MLPLLPVIDGHCSHLIHKLHTQLTHLCWFAINSMSKFHVESSRKLHRFWKTNPCGNYDIDSTWVFRRGFDEILMSYWWDFSVVSTSNRHNFCTCCFDSSIFWYFLLWEPSLNYSGIMLSRCNSNNIDVITDFRANGTISLGNIATMQINRNNDQFFFFKIALTEIIMQ